MGAEIAEIFKATEDYLKEFIDLLQNENKQLTKKHYGELIQLVEQKKALGQKIDQVNQDLVSCMDSIGVYGSYHALSKYITQRLPVLQGNLLIKQWKNILDLLAQAEKLTVANGELILNIKESTEQNMVFLLEKIRTNIYASQ
jgi:flagellar biosynthesis/type III secretory pathway chaperone